MDVKAASMRLRHFAGEKSLVDILNKRPNQWRFNEAPAFRRRKIREELKAREFMRQASMRLRHFAGEKYAQWDSSTTLRVPASMRLRHFAGEKFGPAATFELVATGFNEAPAFRRRKITRLRLVTK